MELGQFFAGLFLFAVGGYFGYLAGRMKSRAEIDAVIARVSRAWQDAE